MMKMCFFFFSFFFLIWFLFLLINKLFYIFSIYTNGHNTSSITAIDIFRFALLINKNVKNGIDSILCPCKRGYIKNLRFYIPYSIFFFIILLLFFEKMTIKKNYILKLWRKKKISRKRNSIKISIQKFTPYLNKNSILF